MEGNLSLEVGDENAEGTIPEIRIGGLTSEQICKIGKGEAVEISPGIIDQLNRVTENDRRLRDQLASQLRELDRLREIEKAYKDIVAFFNSSPHTDGPKMSASQKFVKDTVDTIRARTEVQLRCEKQALVSAVEQIEQKRKNEQGSRIYYQELVLTIRAAVVDHCKAARGCKTDELPAFVKAAVTLAHQNKLAQAIVNIKGHHASRD